MVHNRLADLLAAYGSHIENWPKHDQMLFSERTDDIQITEKFIEAQRLDQQLDSFAVSTNPNLKALITSKIKLRLVDRFYQWLVPNSWKLAWQPAIAAMLVGIWMNFKPLTNVAATKPAKSPTTPPPMAIIASRLSARRCTKNW